MKKAPMASLIVFVVLFAGLSSLSWQTTDIVDDGGKAAVGDLTAAAGGTWNGIMRISDNPMDSLEHDIAIDDQGYKHIVWADNRVGNHQLFYTRIDPQNHVELSEWPITVSSVNARAPSVSADGMGRLHVVWTEFRSGKWDYFYKIIERDDLVSEEVRISDNHPMAQSDEDRANMRYPSFLDPDVSEEHLLTSDITMDDRGRAHIVWINYSHDFFEIYYTVISGDYKVYESRISDSTSDSLSPKVVIDRDAWIAWSERDGNNVEIFSSIIDPYGETLEDTVHLYGSESNDHLRIDLARDHLGSSHIVWSESSNNPFGEGMSNIRYLQYNSTGTFLGPEDLVIKSTLKASNPSILINRTDAFVFWDSQRDGNSDSDTDLYYMTLLLNGTISGERTRITKTPGRSSMPAAAMDEDDLIHLCWVDTVDGNREIYYISGGKDLSSGRVFDPREVITEISLPLIVVTTVSATGALGAYFAADGNRRYASFLGLALYSRIKGKNLLENPVRKSIFDTVQEEPGINFTGLMEALEIKNGVLDYHLKRLEKEGLIRSKKLGMYRCYYPANYDVPPGLQEQIIHLVQGSPGISQSAIAEQLGVSRQMVSYHLSQLEESGIMWVERTKRSSTCFVRTNVIL